MLDFCMAPNYGIPVTVTFILPMSASGENGLIEGLLVFGLVIIALKLTGIQFLLLIP
jgi:hypothetical protein